MSIDIFKDRFPASPEIKGVITRLRKPDESPIATLCRALVDESARGLRGLLKRVPGKGIATEPDELNLLDLTPKSTRLVYLHRSGILFGNSVLAIERTVIDKSFDVSSYTAEHNAAIAGTTIRAVQMGGDLTIPLSTPSLNLMYRLIERDRTFVSFFRDEGLKMMPDLLRQSITLSGLLPEIRETIIPMYQQRAKYLIA